MNSKLTEIEMTGGSGFKQKFLPDTLNFSYTPTHIKGFTRVRV